MGLDNDEGMNRVRIELVIWDGIGIMMRKMMKWKMKWKNNIDESENGWKGSEGRREYIGWEYRMVKWNGWLKKDD